MSDGHRPRTNERGYILLPVAFALVLVGVIAYLLNIEGSMAIERSARNQEPAIARYVAEAGLAHAAWQVQQDGCGGYGLPDTPFGPHRYNAVILPVDGSPVSIAATGTLAGGLSSLLAREQVAVYEPSTTVTLQPDGSELADTWIYKFRPLWNYGSDTEVVVASYWLDSLSRSLMRFDLTSLPAGSKVIAATLELYMKSPSESGGQVGVHRVTADWEEGSQSGGVGAGANWDTRDGTIPWGTPGGDFEQSPVTVTSIPSGVLGWYTWDITSLVDGWHSDSYPNQGFMLRLQELWKGASFHGSDYVNELLRPKLTVTYACECGVGTNGTLVLQPGAEGEDTYLYDGQPDAHFGVDGSIYVSQKSSRVHHGLLRFNLAAIPPAATVTSATLELNLEDISSLNAGSVDVHRLTRSWNELSASWDEYQFALPWLAPGGDYDSAAAASTWVDAAILGPYQWDLTPLVADWVDGTQPNHGMLLAITGAEVDSAKFTSGDAATAAQRPKLTVNYYCPCGVDCSGSDEYYRDEFSNMTCDTAIDYTGSDGSLDWSPWAWDELGESQSSCNGSVTLKADGSNNFLKIVTTISAIERQADLSAFPDAFLSFAYGRRMDAASDHLDVMVSGDGGAGWTVVGQIDGSVVDSAFQPACYDISAFIAPDTLVRFQPVNFDAIGNDNILLDNVQIATGGIGCSAPGGGTLLMVVADPASLTLQEAGKKNLIESWNYTVTLINDGDTQANFDAAMAANDVVYVTGSSSGPALLDKVTGTMTGVVNEINGKLDNFGFCSSTAMFVLADGFGKTDPGHYISEPFAGNPVTAFTTFLSMPVPSGTLAPDLQMVGGVSETPALVTLDAGAERWDGGLAPARRVHLPFGSAETGQLTADGETLLKRALEWAVGTGGGGSPAGTLSLNPSIDSWISQNEININFGTDTQLQVGADAGMNLMRPLLEFDLSALPAAATVTAATLRLYVETSSGPIDRIVGLYRVTADWEEGVATWNNTSGGAFDPTALATPLLAWSSGWKEWPVPPGLIHEWRDGVTSNHGLLLDYLGTKKNYTLKIATREHADSSLRPQLVIEYTEP